MFKGVLDETSKISAGTGDFGVNVDVLMSDQFNEAMSSGLQSVLAGSKTPQEAAEGMQAGAEKGRK